MSCIYSGHSHDLNTGLLVSNLDTLDRFKNGTNYRHVQWESEIRTCSVFEWSEVGWLSNAIRKPDILASLDHFILIKNCICKYNGLY